MKAESTARFAGAGTTSAPIALVKLRHAKSLMNKLPGSRMPDGLTPSLGINNAVVMWQRYRTSGFELAHVGYSSFVARTSKSFAFPLSVGEFTAMHVT